MVEKKEEKHMKRRAVAAMLAAGLILGSLAGCGGQEAESTAQDGQEADASSETGDGQEADAASENGEEPGAETEGQDSFGKYEEEVTLTVARSSSNMAFDTEQDGYGSLEDNVWSRAYKEELGINLDYIWTAPDNEYETKWNVSITAEDIPDVAIVPPSIYKQLLEGGYVQDMTEYYEQYASDAYKAAVEGDGGTCRSVVTSEGRMMGLPHPGATPDEMEYLYIRKDWLDELNLPVPTTMEELVDTAKAFMDAKLGGENTLGMAFCGGLEYAGLGDLRGVFNAYNAFIGGWLEDETGNLIPGSAQPEVKEALQILQEMYRDGVMATDFANANWDTLTEALTSGQCGIVYGNWWLGNADMLYNPETMELGDWIVIEGVTPDGLPCKGYSNATPWHYVFVKNGIEHPEAVVKMLNLQFKLLAEKPETYKVYRYQAGDGTENMIESLYFCIAPFMLAPWEKEVGARIIREALETGDDSKVADLSADYQKYYEDVKSIVKDGNTDVNLAGIYIMYGPDGVFELVDKMWDEDRIYLDKFTSVYSDFGAQNINNMNAALYGEYLKIIMGEDIDNFDKAVETWMKTGGERIIQEVNEWYQSTK